MKTLRYPILRQRSAKTVRAFKPSPVLMLRKQRCKTCPFNPGSPYHTAKTLNQIYDTILNDKNHICHSTSQHICRGARDVHLQILVARGFIKESTDECLHQTMRQAGIEPRHKEYDER